MALQPQRERHWAQNEGVATSSLIPGVRPPSVALARTFARRDLRPPSWS